MHSGVESHVERVADDIHSPGLNAQGIARVSLRGRRSSKNICFFDRLSYSQLSLLRCASHQM